MTINKDPLADHHPKAAAIARYVAAMAHIAKGRFDATFQKAIAEHIEVEFHLGKFADRFPPSRGWTEPL